jgi:DNA polymerase-3 subunit delta'
MQPFPWHNARFQQLVAAKAALPHALLLRGPRGVGKLVFARALSQALLCEAPPPGDGACGACSACMWFEQDAHPDYRQIEAARADADAEEEAGEKKEGKKSNWIKIEQIRALSDFINISSHRGGVKTIVVHPAEALNPNAANALLKSLEEPPPHTHFILVTHRPHQLLPTIKSRCQQIALPVPDARTAAAWLAGQGIRDAELALAHMGDAPLLAAELSGTEYWGARAAFLRQLARRDIDVLTAANAVSDCPIPHVIAWLQKWSYDLVQYHAAGRVRYNPDHAETLAHLAGEVDRLAALRFHREMVGLQRIANHPLNARLFIEEVLLAYRDLVQPQAAVA